MGYHGFWVAFGFGAGSLYFLWPLHGHCILYFACIFRKREWVCTGSGTGSRLSLSLSFEVSLNGFLSVAVFGLPETANSSSISGRSSGHHFAYVAQYSIKYSFIFLLGFFHCLFSLTVSGNNSSSYRSLHISVWP